MSYFVICDLTVCGHTYTLFGLVYICSVSGILAKPAQIQCSSQQKVLNEKYNVCILRLTNSMRGSRKFCHRWSNFEIVFFFLNFFLYLVDGEREDPNTTISGPSLAPSETPFKWRFAGVSMMAQHRMLA